MAASDAAFSRSFNRAENTRKVDKAAAKAEERQGVIDERSDTLFNRSTTLFEQQQKFLKDDRALQKFGRDANRAVSMFRASGGQVFQPMLDTYKSLPDGGQFHEFRRNDDGSFDFEVEWQGQRFKKQGATFDDVGNMMMSIANPAKYLEDSGAAAAAAAKFTQDKEIARIKALKGQKADLKVFNGQITLDQYNTTREKFKDEYLEFLENDPTLLDIPDPGAEEGTRQMTFEEYQADKFGALGIDVTGSQFGGDDEKVGQSQPPNPLSGTFAEFQQFALATGTKPGDETAAAVQAFIDAGRAQELADKFGPLDSESATTLSPALKQRLQEAVTRESGGDPQEDRDQALINVGETNEEEGGGSKANTPVADPLAAFRGKGGAELFSDAVVGASRAITRPVGAVANFLNDQANKASRTISRSASNRVWGAVASGKPRKGSTAFKLLQAASQSEEGRAKVAEIYESIRSQLSPELRASLDSSFRKPDAQLAQNPIPSENRRGPGSDAAVLAP